MESENPLHRPLWRNPDWGGMGDPAFAAPAPRERTTAAGTVSVRELRHPLKGASLRTIRHALDDIHAGKRSRAMENLRQALNDPAARPYALGVLGTEHLKMGFTDIALVELEEAVRLLPGDAAGHNNLGYALGLKGQSERAIEEAGKALQLDPGSPTIRFVLGSLLLKQGREREALYHLKLAAAKIPSARRMLADYYQQHGGPAAEGSIPSGAAAFQASGR